MTASRHSARNMRTRTGIILALALAALTTLIPSARAFTTFEYASARPGIAYAGGTLYMGWSGTDSRHSVNIGAMAFQSNGAFNGWNSVNTIANTGVLLNTGVAITAATMLGHDGDQIVLAYIDSGNNHIQFAHYNGTSNLDCFSELPETSFQSPYLIGIGHDVYVAWTGTDNAGHLNIAKLNTDSCFTNDVVTLDNVVTLNDTATAGPAITSDGTNIYVAWPGTGTGENLWVGQFTGSATLAHHTCLCQYKSFDDVGMTLGVLTYRGTDDHVYHLNLSLRPQGISSGNNAWNGGTTFNGVDVTFVPSGTNIPSGNYVTYAGTDSQINATPF